MVEDDRRTDGTRRQLLGGLASAAAAMLAGCGILGSSGDGDSGGSAGSTESTTVGGPAQFGEFELDGPGSTAVEEPAALTVSALNYGGESGDFEGQVAVAEGPTEATWDVSVPAVGPGERGETEVEVSLDLADDYVLALSEGDAEHDLAVTPQTAGLGEALDIGDRMRATVTDATVRSSVYLAPTDAIEDAFAPPDDRVLVVLRVDVENVGSEAATFGFEPLELPAGTLFDSVGNYGLGAVNGIDGQPAVDVRLSPGQSRSGWLLAQVPREAVTAEYSLDWQRDGSGTRPERRWTVPGADALPDLQLAEWTLPEEPEQGTVSYTVTVENAGDAPGVVRGLVQRGVGDADTDQLRVKDRFEATLDAGERRTFEFETTWRWASPRTFRVQPFGERRTVRFQPAQASFGETVQGPQELSVTVENPRFADEVTVDPIGSDPKTYSPENGQFLVVDGVYEAPNQPANEAALGNFSALVDGETYDHFPTPRGELVDPYEGRRPSGSDIQFFETDRQAFVLLFDVPASADASTVTVGWDNSYNQGTSSIRWSKG